MAQDRRTGSQAPVASAVSGAGGLALSRHAAAPASQRGFSRGSIASSGRP